MLKKAKRSPIGVKGLKKIVFCDRKGRGKKEADMNKIEKMDKFAEKLFSEVDASSIKNIYEGPELGEAIFQKRCRWVKKNLDKYILKGNND
jgi:transcriptional regulator